MKIKNEKKLNLPQLIEWAWDNDIKNEMFIADKQLTNIEFDDTGNFLIYGNGNRKNVKFSIEVEEDITEDTVIPILLTRNTSGGYNEWKDRSIKWFRSEYISAFYILNDDLTMTLIWRDGRLIK